MASNRFLCSELCVQSKSTMSGTSSVKCVKFEKTFKEPKGVHQQCDNNADVSICLPLPRTTWSSMSLPHTNPAPSNAQASKIVPINYSIRVIKTGV